MLTDNCTLVSAISYISHLLCSMHRRMPIYSPWVKKFCYWLSTRGRIGEDKADEEKSALKTDAESVGNER